MHDGADGLVWTDVAAFRNMTTPVTVAQAGMTVAYVPVNDTWWVSTVSGGSLVTSRMYGGGGAFVGGVSSPTAGVLNIEPRAVAFDPINNYLVCGVTPTASSNVKYRRSLQTGINAFTAHNSTQTNTSGPRCLGWAGGTINLLISGHFSTGVVETSADGGATWINRTVPNADGRLSIAFGGVASSSVVISSDTAQSRVIQSSDGINWS